MLSTLCAFDHIVRTGHAARAGNAVGACGNLGCARKRKRKCRARTFIRCRPQSAMMTLDNGPADRQADPHTAALCRVEGVEEPVYTLRVDTSSHILNAEPHTLAFLQFSFDHQLPRT